MELHSFGKGLLVTGLLLTAVGAAVLWAPKVPWLGRLPGDIFIQKDHFSFYFPLATCLLVSVVLSLFFRLFKK